MPKVLFALPLLAMILAAAPAQAQTYDPRYPVCLHVFGELEGERIDCLYSTMAQCRASASGRSAMCEVNPNFPQVTDAPPVYRRHQRAQ